MEITSKFKELRETQQSPLNSPNSTTTTTTTTSCSNNINNNNGGGVGIPITRSDPNSPYPTTFVTADTTSFKQVVQMLTGSSDNTTSPRQQPPQPPSHHHHHHHQQPSHNPPPTSAASKNFVIPPIRTAPKKQGFKLYERRNSALKNMISPLNAAVSYHQNASFSPRKMPEILSPSLLDFPSLTLSPVTPLLVEDPFDKSSPSIGGSGSSASSSEEEKAIAQKGYYLHPSPMSTPRDSEPQLLPLFPLSSPRVSES